LADRLHAWRLASRRNLPNKSLRNRVLDKVKIVIWGTTKTDDGTHAAGMLGLLGKDCMLLADRGYDGDALRAQIESQGA